MHSSPVSPPAPPLPAPFMPCPVCRGTVSMNALIIQGRRRIFSICQSCDSRWDLQGNPIHMGMVVRLPTVDNLRLPCNNFAGCTSRRPRSHGGRPPGSRDRYPRNHANKRKEEL